MLFVIHSQFWTKRLGLPAPREADFYALEDPDKYTIDDPDPGPSPPDCESCGRRYAIRVPMGRGERLLCGICLCAYLDSVRRGQRERHIRRQLGLDEAAPVQQQESLVEQTA